MTKIPKRWRFAGKIYHRVALTEFDGTTVVTWRRWRRSRQVWVYGADDIESVQLILNNFKE